MGPSVRPKASVASRTVGGDGGDPVQSVEHGEDGEPLLVHQGMGEEAQPPVTRDAFLVLPRSLARVPRVRAVCDFVTRCVAQR
jgi:hypothetical protein